MDKKAIVPAVIFLAGVPSLGWANGVPGTVWTPSLNEKWGRTPLAFIRNGGQLDSRIKYFEKEAAQSVYVAPEGIYTVLRSKEKSGKTARERLLLKPLDANPSPEIEAAEPLRGRVNYFVGDAKRWRRDLPTYRKIRYGNLYPGIDLIFYGNGRQLEYDLVVSPGADTSRVRFDYRGATSLRIDEKGNLCVRLPSGKEIVQKKPYVYQKIGGKKVTVEGRYELLGHKGEARFGFSLGHYDPRYALVIDPVLVYSTYLGGSAGEVGNAIAVDSEGNAYVAGSTASDDFPLKNALKEAGDGSDAFVTKFDRSGTLVYSTYLGGSQSDSGAAIAVDAEGYAYIAGTTNSPDFPTKNAYDTSCGVDGECDVGSQGDYVSDCFVVKLSPSGDRLTHAGYLGGSGGESCTGIAIDARKNVYVTGVTSSADFPLKNPLQSQYGGKGDVFVTKFKASQKRLAYSTYLGGSEKDESAGIAVDTKGYAYVAGTTSSVDFPTKNAYDPTCGTETAKCDESDYWYTPDAFVSKLSLAGHHLIYSTFLGGSDWDKAFGIAVDTQGSAYVAGYTSSYDFPVKNPYQERPGGKDDAFVTKMSRSGKVLAYSTYLGGGGDDRGFAIAVDARGNAYVTGFTYSDDFPMVNAYQKSLAGGSDAFVTELNASGRALAYSTFLGGEDFDFPRAIAVDSRQNIYTTGDTRSADFPTENAYQKSLGGFQDAYVAKIGTPAPVALEFVAPGGGERWKAGHRYTLRWHAPKEAVKFVLRYSTDNAKSWKWIRKVTAKSQCKDDGAKLDCRYRWKIPPQNGTKPNSYVQLVARDSKNRVVGKDTSDAPFTIEVLKLLAPNGGETFEAGSLCRIKWRSYALNRPIAKAILQYSTDGGKSWSPIKAFRARKSGRFDWTLPDTPSDRCKVRVILKAKGGKTVAADASDKVFEIK